MTAKASHGDRVSQINTRATRRIFHPAPVRLSARGCTKITLSPWIWFVNFSCSSDSWRWDKKKNIKKTNTKLCDVTKDSFYSTI